MKRHKVWYKRHLFKKHFKLYKDWDDYNPPSAEKHPGRYRSDVLQCKNPECSREGMMISEHEAFYYYAKQSFVKKISKKIIQVIRKKKIKAENNSLYICPFCGGDDVREIQEKQ